MSLPPFGLCFVSGASVKIKLQHNQSGWNAPFSGFYATILPTSMDTNAEWWENHLDSSDASAESLWHHFNVHSMLSMLLGMVYIGQDVWVRPMQAWSMTHALVHRLHEPTFDFPKTLIEHCLFVSIQIRLPSRYTRISAVVKAPWSSGASSCLW